MFTMYWLCWELFTWVVLFRFCKTIASKMLAVFRVQVRNLKEFD